MIMILLLLASLTQAATFTDQPAAKVKAFTKAFSKDCATLNISCRGELCDLDFTAKPGKSPSFTDTTATDATAKARMLELGAKIKAETITTQEEKELTRLVIAAFVAGLP